MATQLSSWANRDGETNLLSPAEVEQRSTETQTLAESETGRARISHRSQESGPRPFQIHPLTTGCTLL